MVIIVFYLCLFFRDVSRAFESVCSVSLKCSSVFLCFIGGGEFGLLVNIFDLFVCVLNGENKFLCFFVDVDGGGGFAVLVLIVFGVFGVFGVVFFLFGVYVFGS